MVVLSHEALRELAARLVSVGGVVGVMLGGSRARGDATPESDVDLGLYYRPPLDVTALGVLAREVAGFEAQVTAPGDWGPWVDGGAWLSIAGTAVDWIYRDLDRVHAVWETAMQGRFRYHFQVGHPLGYPDFTYAGEVALGVVLADPGGELTALQLATRAYPEPLAAALLNGLGEAAFVVQIARKAVARNDVTYVAGCLFRIVGLCAHAIHGTSRRWLLNEKGAVAAAAGLPTAPAGFAERAHGLLAGLSPEAADLGATIDAAEQLVRDTEAACHAGT